MILLAGCSPVQLISPTTNITHRIIIKDQVAMVMHEHILNAPRSARPTAMIYVAPKIYRKATEAYRSQGLGILRNPFNRNRRSGKAKLFRNLAAAIHYAEKHHIIYALDPESNDYWTKIKAKTNKRLEKLR